MKLNKNTNFVNMNWTLLCAKIWFYIRSIAVLVRLDSVVQYLDINQKVRLRHIV